MRFRRDFQITFGGGGGGHENAENVEFTCIYHMTSRLGVI